MLSSQEQRRRIAVELDRLSRLRAGAKPVEPMTATGCQDAGGDLESIAIIGLSGYFPGCMSVEAFWQALDEDRCLIEPPPKERLALWSQLQPEQAEFLARGVQGGGFIPDIRSFAPAFFDILPGQAHAMDPRQRLLLMSVYHTLEDAGYVPGSLKQQPVGVFVGIEEDEYFQTLLDLGVPPTGGDGLAASMVANRISWFFDFRGPSEVVNTMCSGAAVALHRAVGSLRSKETTMAVVGGANLLLRPEPFIQLGQTGQLSPDLSVRSFGKEARGFLRAEGVASVLLKRLSQAEADGDPIYAVIRHTAVNYNGKGGISMAAPDIAAHAELIERCYRQAGIDPRDVQYVEAQGMGNPVADLGEWQAINRALARLALERGVPLTPGGCRIGTLKPMTGHMHSASALGALFKIIRSLRTGTIHKILGFSELNPDLDCPGQPGAPARDTEAWPSSGRPRLAGIHAYGAGGNNAHLLIEEYQEPAAAARRPRLPGCAFALKDCWYDHLPHPTPANTGRKTDDANGPDRAESIVRALLGRYLEVDPEQVNLDAAFVDQGFNSMLVAEFASELRRQHAIQIEPARFFEFKTPRQFARALADFIGGATPDDMASPAHDRRESPAGVAGARGGASFTPIAIIGLAGRYPASATVEEFWDNLRAGRDCISEIPEGRWRVADHFDPNPETAAKNGKSYGKWGGFISGLNEFDPLFFKISPLEAETMNPKERLVLETVWHVLEDAGHTPESLSSERVGVFFGVTRAGWDPYPGTFSSVANRVSYFGDFHGPSVALDTMCSSSLVAIHEACQHLQTGGCDVAIAGGVNLYLDPSHFVVLAHGRFLSPDGKCRAFGAGANGMTPGEGVGAVLLKPLERAVRDGDRIYGVIRGTACNHGGNANGFTVPNPVAQKDLVLQALETAKVNPRQITYVEAHGTGTSLGDPIEIRGLTEAYRQRTSDCGFCRVGSLKSNMGHLEAAAGIASLTKVLMQMRHRELVASIHALELNPNIDFSSTPFVVPQSLEPWRPVDTEGHPVSRLAAVSSFGAGGSNAHLIVEEFPVSRKAGQEEEPQLIVLSARTEDRLLEMARNLHDFIQRHPDASLRNVAYTLQVGREAMDERLATRVASLEQLRERLRLVRNKTGAVADVYCGRVETRRNTTEATTSEREDARSMDGWMRERDLERLGQAWVNGGRVEWNRLYPGEKPRRMGLPLYPFARTVIPRLELTLGPGAAGNVGEVKKKDQDQDYDQEQEQELKAKREAELRHGHEGKALHPLAQRNTSTLNAQRFTSTLTGREFFLADHVVEGRKMLSAAACLEMARAAVELSLPPRTSPQTNGDATVSVLRLSQIVWARPLCVADQPTDVHVAIKGNPSGPISFEIQAPSDTTAGQVSVHGQGVVELGFSAAPDIIDIEAIRSDAPLEFSAEQCYAAFAALGIDYGPGHRGIDRLYVGADQVLARLRLPDSIQDTASQYVLHPSLIDAAFQASIGFGFREAGVKPESRAGSANGNGKLALDQLSRLKPCLPYAIEQVEVFEPCTPSMWAVIRRPSGKGRSGAVETFDLDLCDDLGTLLVRIRGFAARVLQPAPAESEKPSLILRVPHWETREAFPPEGVRHSFERRVVVCCGFEPPVSATSAAERAPDDIVWIHVPLKGKRLAKDFHDALLKTFGAIRSILDAKPAGDSLIQVLMPAGGPCLAHSGLVGMLRTAHLESPALYGQLIQTDPPPTTERGHDMLRENAGFPDDTWIRYHEGRRQVASWIDPVPSIPRQPWKADGVYLITGGLGGLGRIFAEEIAGKAPRATLILIGRSEPGVAGNQFLQSLRDRGVKADYQRVDLRQRDKVRECVRAIIAASGTIHGILHTAGVLRDQYLLGKSAQDIEWVLGPKVTGTVNLDEATRELPLDFFVLFSSGAALGNSGQGDYAAANAFLDGFARYRNELVIAGTRKGTTISIAWPLWKEGGMRMDATAQRLMSETTGLVAMETPAGLDAFYQCMAGGQAHVLVLNGVPSRVHAALAPPPAPPTVAPDVEQPPSSDAAPGEAPARPAIATDLDAQVTDYLKRMIGETLKIQPAEIETRKDLFGYGLDSIIALDVNNRLERDFPRLSKTLFFEYATIQELAGYFVRAHRPILERMFAVQTTPPVRRQPALVVDYRPVSTPRSTRVAAPLPVVPATPSAPPIQTDSDTRIAATEARAAQRPTPSLSVDEIIRTFEVDIVHPTPRPSIRSPKAEDWPNWHSLFQSFAIFDTVEPGFSFSRMVAGGDDASADAARYLRGQVDLRRVLFSREDFRRVSRIVDLGCGRAADLIELALEHPGLSAHGLTVDPGEAAFAHRMIRRQGLDDRVRVMIQDNADHEFEPGYDLAFSIQVMHFIPELDRKRALFRKLASALCEDGVLLMAEFVSLLAKPLRDPALNTTVHCAREWAEVLGENGLVLDEVIDLSAGIANFLQDPHLERHVAALDEKRRLELRKYNRQVASLENHWVSYGVMRALKDHRQTPPEQLIRKNLERLKKPVQPARTGSSNGRLGTLYKNLTEHFQNCVAPTSRPLPTLSNHGH